MKTWTPYELEVFLWHAVRPVDACYEKHTALYEETIRAFRRDKLMNPDDHGMAPRGLAFLTMLLETPLPEPRWIDPREQWMGA